MPRSIAFRVVVTAVLAAAFIAAPIKIGFATTPQDAQPKPEEKTYTGSSASSAAIPRR